MNVASRSRREGRRGGRWWTGRGDDVEGRVGRRARVDDSGGWFEEDRLLDTLSGDAEGKLSNRAKFRALPIDGAIMGGLKSIIWRRGVRADERRVLRNREEISEVTARYAMYDVGMLDSRTRSLLGVGRSKRTAKFIAAAAKEGSEPPATRWVRARVRLRMTSRRLPSRAVRTWGRVRSSMRYR